jgi:hypothetical protein
MILKLQSLVKKKKILRVKIKAKPKKKAIKNQLPKILYFGLV